MEIDMEGLPPGAVNEFLKALGRIETESDARRAISGEPAKPVLIGSDPISGRLIIIRPDEG
ncbi:MAG: hypothetical protein ACM3Q9_02050 [Methanosarcina sp.]